MRTAIISAAAILLFLFCASSPALAAKPEMILVNALEIDSAGNTFAESDIQLNGRPYQMGQAAEAGFLQNVSSRPVVLAFSDGRVMNLAPGETVMLAPAADPAVKCLCRCGAGTDSRDLFTFSDTTEAACKGHDGQRCLRGSNGVISSLSGCGLTWTTTATPSEPAEPGTEEEAPIEP